MRLLAWDWWRARPAAAGSAVLALLYTVTLAPTVTLWDSGEFLAAIHSLGVPHPPGTPLFVYAARAWTELAGVVLPFDVGVNIGSAFATAVACGLLARTLLPAGGARFHATVIGGIASSVWASATEAEVYAWALLLMALMMAVGSNAGRRGDRRDALLLAFLFGLAVPLHLSALLAGPAAIMLAASDAEGAVSRRALGDGLAAWLLAGGLGTLSPAPVIGALLLAVCLYVVRVRGHDSGITALASLPLVALGASFVMVMWVRAQHDPFVNQGNASTWGNLLDVIGRRQYDVPGLVPRRAPLWLQIGNVVQYGDWQFGRALSASVGPSLWRTPITVALLLLGVGGAMEHRRADPRTFRAMGLHGESEGSFGVDEAFASQWGPGVGVEIMGRNKFGPQRGPWENLDWKGWWGPDPPFHTPTFILTHHPRPPIEMEGGTTFHFVDASPAEALKTARAAAGGQDVRLGGGATMIREFLAAGLIDHMHIAVVPILLGRGVRLWDGLEGLERDYEIEATSSPSGVTHLMFTRRAAAMQA